MLPRFTMNNGEDYLFTNPKHIGQAPTSGLFDQVDSANFAHIFFGKFRRSVLFSTPSFFWMCVRPIFQSEMIRSFLGVGIHNILKTALKSTSLSLASAIFSVTSRTTDQPTFLNSVIQIVLASSQPKVFWISARWIIARMANKKALRDGSAHQFKNDAMGSVGQLLNFYPAIPRNGLSFYPRPTSFWAATFIESIKKPLLEFFSKYDHWDNPSIKGDLWLLRCPQ